MRPDSITNEDIIRWNNNINNDPSFPQEYLESEVIMEVCRAGLYLTEELERLQCPEELIVRIQFSAGKASFGNDCWDVHQQFLSGYINNQLDFEIENCNDLN